MDYGAKVSQKGYNVGTCADRLLAFSSAFQTLKVFNVYSVSGTIPEDDENIITVNHALGYYAPFVVVYNGSSRTGTNTSYFFSDSQGWGIGSLCMQYIDKLEIEIPYYFDEANSEPGDTVYFTVYQFLDDFSTISQSTIGSSTTQEDEAGDYGFKSSKDGKDVKTCGDEDLIVSSSFFTQIVHRKGSTTEASITHDLGYTPNYLSYKKYVSHSYMTWDGQGGITNESLVFGYYGGDYTYYYVILKNKSDG